jgi:hypothetical protein
MLPFMVIGTAGTTAAGIIDPLPEIATLLQRRGLWFHADAAYGGAAVVSPSLQASSRRHRVADSITCDAHKWLSVPMGCGMFFCRHRESVAQAFRSDVTYMPAKAGERRCIGHVQSAHAFGPVVAAIYRAQAFHGAGGARRGRVRAMLEHQARMGNVLRESLEATGLAHREFHAAAGHLLYARWNCSTALCSRSCASGRSRGCRMRRLAAFRSCAHASPASNHREDIEWVVRSDEQSGIDLPAKDRVNGMNKRILKDGWANETGNDRNPCGYEVDPTTKAVAVPIYQTVAYAFDSADHAAALFNLEAEGFRYTRIQNPTTAVLERRVAALEGGLGSDVRQQRPGSGELRGAQRHRAGMQHRFRSRSSTAPRTRSSRTSCRAGSHRSLC